MVGKIFLISDDEDLEELTETPYVNEDLLQTLLERYPDLLAGELINESSPRRWLLVSREVAIPDAESDGRNMYLDHLFLDQDGVPTLVEVKRSSDTRIRREVVGQLLDYAANAVVYWPVEEIRARYVSECELQGMDAEASLQDFLGIATDDEGQVDRYWQNVKTNLKAGKIRMIFVADEIPVQLRRIIEFLNEQMDPAEVVGIELRQYVGQGIKTIVPRIFGQTEEASQRKGTATRPKNKWDEQSFFADLAESSGEEVVNATRHILEWSKLRSTRVWWGEGKTRGSFVPVLHLQGIDHQFFAVWSNGYVELYFQWYQGKQPFSSDKKRDELRHRLNEIPGVDLSKDVLGRRPSIRTEVLVHGQNLEKFFSAFEWFIEEIITASFTE